MNAQLDRFFIVGWLLTLALVRPVPGQELRYDLSPDQKFSYSVTITVDQGDKVTTYRGNIHYTVQSANEEQIKLTYRGGLNESNQIKQTLRGNDGRFGGFPRGPMMMPPPSPFHRTPFAGRIQTTNRIIMTPAGRILSMEGDSQLPFLLGNVSLLPFEALPQGDQKEWVLDSGVSITEGNEDRRPFGAPAPFGPPIPFGPRGFGHNADKVVQAATEVTRYSIAGKDGDLIQVKRTSELKSPTTDEESFEMNGTGVWTFDSNDHVPHSLDVTSKLTVKEGNTTTAFPITIKYERLSEETLAKMEADAKQAQEELKRKADAEKELASTPLTASEKQRALAALKESNADEIKRTLAELEKKSLADTDDEITAAIKRHLNHKNNDVVEAARKAMAKWSSTYAKKEALRKKYDGPGVVESTDREVDSTTQLFVGQVLQAQEHGSFWFPARVKSLQPGGKVEVEFMQWGKPGRTSVLMRRNLQLAPEELEQPGRQAGETTANSIATTSLSTTPVGNTSLGNASLGNKSLGNSSASSNSASKPAVGSAPSASSDAVNSKSFRTWSDVSGRFKIDAAYKGMVNDQVRLERADGREVNIPLEKLSSADQAHVKQLLEVDENPFVPK